MPALTSTLGWIKVAGHLSAEFTRQSCVLLAWKVAPREEIALPATQIFFVRYQQSRNEHRP
jgi:hypothetical protein